MNDIGRMAPDGDLSEFFVSTTANDMQPNIADVTTGPDGNLWFTETTANKIGRMTPASTFTEFSIPSSPSSPIGITAGPDGNLWFTESDLGLAGGSYGLGKIGRITPKGVITEFPLPGTDNNPLDIFAGPDDSLWFTQQSGDIGSITAGT